MTMLFMDSFDHYETEDITKKWTSNESATYNVIHASEGRRGGGCLKMSNSTYAVTKGFATTTTIIVGMAMKITSATTNSCVYLSEGSTNHVVLQFRSGGVIGVLRGVTEIGTSSSSAYPLGEWFYFEIKAYTNDSAGYVQLRVNGTLVLDPNPQNWDTNNGGTPTFDTLKLSSTSTSNPVWVDDLYILNTSGSTNNAFLNDIRVDCYYPNGDGNSSQMVGSDGNSTSNYLLVDDGSATHGAGIDDDTTYVESDTVSNKDLYTFTDMSHDPNSIYAVQITAMARKTATGSRALYHVTRRSTTDYDSSTFNLGDSYAGTSSIRETDPSTSGAWSKTNFNAAEFGVKIAS